MYLAVSLKTTRPLMFQVSKRTLLFLLLTISVRNLIQMWTTSSSSKKAFRVPSTIAEKYYG